jgi:hypothetical protein
MLICTILLLNSAVGFADTDQDKRAAEGLRLCIDVVHKGEDALEACQEQNKQLLADRNSLMDQCKQDVSSGNLVTTRNVVIGVLLVAASILIGRGSK